MLRTPIAPTHPTTATSGSASVVRIVAHRSRLDDFRVLVHEHQHLEVIVRGGAVEQRVVAREDRAGGRLGVDQPSRLPRRDGSRARRRRNDVLPGDRGAERDHRARPVSRRSHGAGVQLFLQRGDLVLEIELAAGRHVRRLRARDRFGAVRPVGAGRGATAAIGVASSRRQRTHVQSSGLQGFGDAVLGAELIDGAATFLGGHGVVVVDDRDSRRPPAADRARRAPARVAA